MSGLEDHETLLGQKYVREWEGTARSSRHFRNHWLHNRQLFSGFRDFLLHTWPEVSDISLPTIPEAIPPRLVMFYVEDGQSHEVSWAGSGFQVPCRAATHLLQALDADLIVIDEPEIYLHADVQRRLVHLLRELGASVIVATHSAEVITEVEASDLVIVDRRRTSSRRTASPSRTRNALAAVGSNHNVVLSNLVRTRHVLFVEGEDFKILRRWARVIGLDQLAAPKASGSVPFPYGGFPQPAALREVYGASN